MKGPAAADEGLDLGRYWGGLIPPTPFVINPQFPKSPGPECRRLATFLPLTYFLIFLINHQPQNSFPPLHVKCSFFVPSLSLPIFVMSFPSLKTQPKFSKRKPPVDHSAEKKILFLSVFGIKIYLILCIFLWQGKNLGLLFEI